MTDRGRQLSPGRDVGTAIVNKHMCLSWVMLRGVESYNHSATNEEGILLAHLDPAWYGRTACTQKEICKGQSDSEMTDALGSHSSLS